MKAYTTKELIDKLKMNSRKIFEAAMDNSSFRVTHFIEYSNGKIYDVGIDSKEVIRRKKDFIRHYLNAFWVIDQIV